MIDPETPEQWQMAVDLAHGALALHSSRLYGVVEGGPEVDVIRCEEVLGRGAELGYTPGPQAVERFVLAYAPATLPVRGWRESALIAEALKERDPSDIWAVVCDGCGSTVYYNDGSHCTCEHCDRSLDHLIENPDTSEVISLADLIMGE